MTELTGDEFYEVLSKYSSGQDIEGILLKEHSNTEITVLIGTAFPGKKHYVHDAFFFRDTMEMALSDVEKDKQFLARPYFLASGTMAEVKEGNLHLINPFRTRVNITQVDQLNIYEHLKSGLYERARTVEMDITSKDSLQSS
ncbi:hypothetical protein HOM13_02185 [Candidatus Woesearchaeota archaeon]|jgi:hypothetical protein|nr:hypothetical protein [Candidatus Woesearchaeota archaeon]MBT5215523.1 hypothetical protein [Candidatus Woesearchaeota archaeon]MBT6402244.1 hypothetical protein [Candidatus Woesearchaeota archaeon]